VDVTTLLLDTHAYVWALTDPNRLSDRARTAVADPSNVLLVSAATAWEMAIKHRAGKWPEAEILSRLGAELLAITAADAIRAGNLDWEHTDPFDRMLAAQALLRHATLLTRDEAFRDLRGLNILW
jgi:PIN domain nuclease of toxin-antitoxin system